MWISVIICFGCPAYQAGHASVWHGKNFDIGCYAQAFQPCSFIPSMLTGSINLCHFYTTLDGFDLGKGHKISEKLNFWGSLSCILVNWSGWNLWCLQIIVYSDTTLEEDLCNQGE